MHIDQVRAHFLSEPVLDAAAAAVEASAQVWTGFARNDAKVCLRAALEAGVLGRPAGVTSDWVTCPVCGESDMRMESDEHGHALISCMNHNCFSNGGTNRSALPPAPPARMSHEEYVAECDEDQLRNLIERANARIEKLSKSGWAKLWTVTIGWANVGWFAEDDHASAVEFAQDVLAADARRNPGKGLELEVKLERYRPEEVPQLLAATKKIAAPKPAQTAEGQTP